MTSALRLFVAVGVPASARAALHDAVAPLRGDHPLLRWTAPVDWHVTVAFIGETPVGWRPRTELAVGAAVRGSPGCALTVDGTLGRFGRRVLWASVAPSTDALHRLAAAVRASLAAQHLPVAPQPFHPHLTLARTRRGHRLPTRRAVDGAGLPAVWTVDRVALMTTGSAVGGARHRAIASWPLTVGDA